MPAHQWKCKSSRGLQVCMTQDRQAYRGQELASLRCLHVAFWKQARVKAGQLWSRCLQEARVCQRAT